MQLSVRFTFQPALEGDPQRQRIVVTLLVSLPYRILFL